MTSGISTQPLRCSSAKHVPLLWRTALRQAFATSQCRACSTQQRFRPGLAIFDSAKCCPRCLGLCQSEKRSWPSRFRQVLTRNAANLNQAREKFSAKTNQHCFAFKKVYELYKNELCYKVFNFYQWSTVYSVSEHDFCFYLSYCLSIFRHRIANRKY